MKKLLWLLLFMPYLSIASQYMVQQTEDCSLIKLDKTCVFRCVGVYHESMTVVASGECKL